MAEPDKIPQGPKPGSARLEVDVSAAVAGQAGSLQLQNRLLVGTLDGEAWQERVPVLVDVAYCRARGRLHLHLWAHTRYVIPQWLKSSVVQAGQRSPVTQNVELNAK